MTAGYNYNNAQQDYEVGPLFYPGDSLHKAKIRKVNAILSDHGIDALLLLLPESVRYLTDFYVTGYRPFWEWAYLVAHIPGHEPVLGYGSGSDSWRMPYHSVVPDRRQLPSHDKWGDAIAEILAEYGVRSGTVGTDLLPYYLHDRIVKHLPHITFVNASPLWEEICLFKEAEEINIMRRALEIAQTGMAAAIDAVQEGASEIEVSAEAEYVMRRAGSEVLPFVPVILSGVNIGVCARVATSKKIGANEMVQLDLGCVYRGYVGEFGRSAFVGEPSELHKAYYQTVLEAISAIENIARPGVSCHDLDAAARQVFDDAGFGKYKPRRPVGHQLGYGLHGKPPIGPNVSTPLRPSMIFNVEPSLRVHDKPELGGAHIEDTFLVTEGGVERLTTFPYDAKLLD